MFGAAKFRTFLKHPGYNDPVSITAVVSAVATVGGFISSQQQSAAQKKSIEAQKKIADAQAARERIQAAREARIRRAQILASTGNQGVGAASSGPAGAVSSIGSQLGSNIANINTIQNFADKASKANQQAVDAQATGAMFQQIGKIGGVTNPWQSIFNTETLSVDQLKARAEGQALKKQGVW